MDNYMSFRFKAIAANESLARSVVAAFCVPSNPTLDIINDIKTSISEAVTNCIVHGYGKNTGDIMIEAEIKDDLFSVRVIDYGKGILNIDEALNDFYTTNEEDERSGLGFTIMKTFMDSLEVESVWGAGTTVTMTKNLNA
ncbi:MAG: anti-sigma F factor [Clostridiales bacterium]|nr:anti-sigma F factor [Clostridiales bacterium]